MHTPVEAVILMVIFASAVESCMSEHGLGAQHTKQWGWGEGREQGLTIQGFISF